MVAKKHKFGPSNKIILPPVENQPFKKPVLKYPEKTVASLSSLKGKMGFLKIIKFG